MHEVVRLRLDVAYDGTDFSGWARQPGRRTVQSTLESALAMVLRCPGITLTVAGRTDAGVHASGQVCSVDVPAESLAALPPERLAYRLTRVLPGDARVRRVVRAPAGFDARFSALWRRYSYRIWDDPVTADPLKRRTVLTWQRPLHETAMNEAARGLLGEHDFAAFCRRREGATTIRTLRELTWTREDELLVARVVADAFCHSMVRSLVGCLLVVGEAKQPVDWAAAILNGGTRDSRVPVVPPHGLTLEEVGYPPDVEVAERATAARSTRTLA